MYRQNRYSGAGIDIYPHDLDNAELVPGFVPQAVPNVNTHSKPVIMQHRIHALYGKSSKICICVSIAFAVEVVAMGLLIIMSLFTMDGKFLAILPRFLTCHIFSDNVRTARRCRCMRQRQPSEVLLPLLGSNSGV